MRKEYANTKITIQTVCPMMVATKMSKVRKTSYFTPSPEEFAKQAVRSIGHVSETTGCLPHQIQASFCFFRHNFQKFTKFEFLGRSNVWTSPGIYNGQIGH